MIRNDSAISDLGKMNVTVSAFCPCWMKFIWNQQPTMHLLTKTKKKYRISNTGNKINTCMFVLFIYYVVIVLMWKS